jgi:hypothetical protein
MEFYSATTKNEILLSAGKWMELKNIMFNGVSQVQKDKGHMFSLTCGRRIQIQALSYLHINIYRKNFQKWDVRGD